MNTKNTTYFCFKDITRGVNAVGQGRSNPNPYVAMQNLGLRRFKLVYTPRYNHIKCEKLSMKMIKIVMNKKRKNGRSPRSIVV